MKGNITFSAPDLLKDTFTTNETFELLEENFNNLEENFNISEENFNALEENFNNLTLELDTKQLKLQSIITEEADYTIASSGYVSYPSPLPSGAIGISANVYYWSSNSGAFSVSIYQGGQGTQYISGTPGATIKKLRIQYWYYMP